MNWRDTQPEGTALQMGDQRGDDFTWHTGVKAMIDCDKVCVSPAVTRTAMFRTPRALESSTIPPLALPHSSLAVLRH